MNSTQPSTTTQSFPLPFDDSGTLFVACTIFPLCFFGVVANTITIVVILLSPKLKSSFYWIMLSLSVSDLLSAVISPLFVYRRTWGYEYWDWGSFLCKIFWAVDIWTSYVTSLHILMFALLRSISVQWPRHFNAFTVKRTKILIIVVWIVSFACGFIPFAIWFDAFEKVRNDGIDGSNWPSCTLNTDRESDFDTYTKVAYSFFFYIPIILVTFLSIATVVKLVMLRKERSSMIARQSIRNQNTAEAKRRRKEKQIMLQLGLIVGSFLIGYIPRTAYHFQFVSAPSNQEQAVINWWFSVMEYLILRISECLNPIFYNVSSSKMRNETKTTLKLLCKNCSKNPESKAKITNTISTSQI